jgi:hypothetical protein
VFHEPVATATAHETRIRRWPAFTPPQSAALAPLCGLFFLRRSHYGIGPNLASKLLAVYDPDRFVVINGPVERALIDFGFASEDLDPMNGTKYDRFLKELQVFIEEAQILRLVPAAALDAFFYFYGKAESRPI